MKTSTVTPADLGGSVISVPPLARGADGSISEHENSRIIDWMHSGGVSTYLYGGNANLYNMSVTEFGSLCDMLERIAGDDCWMIPSVGPDFGKSADQLALLRERSFPTAMVLPMTSSTTLSGTATGMRRLAEIYGRPLIAYVKYEGYLDASDIAALVHDGVVCAVKYAVVRSDPVEDRFLSQICDALGETSRLVSGIGERPVIEHFRRFGLAAFTSGSVAVAPHLSTAILHALNAGDTERASALREAFLPLEDLRDRHSPPCVLHEAVRLARIAETGPMAPFLSNIADPGILDAIGNAAARLRDESLAASKATAAE